MEIPKIIAVIPVFGRELLLPFTIKRLLTKNKVYKVICCGNRLEDKKICIENNSEWVDVANNPLGNKWNMGFKLAKKYNPDGILFVGSSDWIPEKWINYAWNFIKNEDYQMVGKKDFYMVDISVNNEIKFCKWLGYINQNRINEPIGIGRLIGKKFLEKINYMPFESNQNNSMDYFMYKKCVNNNFKIKLIHDDNFKFLSISTNAWINKHKFYRHYSGALIEHNKEIIKIMKQYFLVNVIISFKKNNIKKFIIYLEFLFLVMFLKANKKISKNLQVYNKTSKLLNANEIEQINNEFSEIYEFNNIIKNTIQNKNIIIKNEYKIMSESLMINIKIFKNIWNNMGNYLDINKLESLINNILDLKHYNIYYNFNHDIKNYFDDLSYIMILNKNKNINSTLNNYINNLIKYNIDYSKIISINSNKQMQENEFKTRMKNLKKKNNFGDMSLAFIK